MKKALVMICLFVFLPAIALAVDFRFTDLDGKTYTGTDLQGTPLVINVGAHWWKKCKVEAPALEKAYQSFKGKGVLFLGVFVTNKDKDIREFAETYHQTFPVGKDTDVAKALDVKAIPETLFIGRDGQVVQRHRDIINYEELVTGIEKLLWKNKLGDPSNDWYSR